MKEVINMNTTNNTIKFADWEVKQNQASGNFNIRVYVPSMNEIKHYSLYLKFGVVYMARQGNYGNLKRILDKLVDDSYNGEKLAYKVQRITETATQQIITGGNVA
jgi:hypothetical protein